MGASLYRAQVVGIMRVNVEKVLERDQKLSSLDDRAGEVRRVPGGRVVATTGPVWPPQRRSNSLTANPLGECRHARHPSPVVAVPRLTGRVCLRLTGASSVCNVDGRPLRPGPLSFQCEASVY